MPFRLLLCLVYLAATHVACAPAAIRLQAPIADEIPLAALNLSFEDAASGSSAFPSGWTFTGQGYEAHTDATHTGTGERSLRIVRIGPGSAAVVSRSMSAVPYRGLRVSWSLHVKRTEGTIGAAAPWIRVDGPFQDVLALDNLASGGMTKDGPWTRLTATVYVPPEATRLAFGGLFTGDGVAWFDLGELEKEEAGPIEPSAIAGIVRDSNDHPIAGANITATQGGFFAASATTDQRGVFSLRGIGPSDFTISAAHISAGFAFRSVSEKERRGLSLTLSDESTVVLHGRLATKDGSAVSADVLVSARSINGSDSLVHAKEGRFSARVPASTHGYFLTTMSETSVGTVTLGDTAQDEEILLKVEVSPAVNRNLTGWVSTAAVPFRGETDVALSPFSIELLDLATRSRVIALGEATHGTREFFQAKAVMIRTLIEHGMTRTIGLEANWVHCSLIDSFLQGGDNAPEGVFDAWPYWMWSTEEIRDLFAWIRNWNARQTPANRVHLYGFDPQNPELVAARLRAADSSASASVLDALATSPPSTLTKDELEAERRDFERYAENAERAWAASSSADELWRHRQELRVLRQELESRRVNLAGYAGDSRAILRDRHMAENVMALAERNEEDRIVIWAHNTHIAAFVDDFPSMGSMLRRKLGERYLPIGLLFRQGAFQALGPTPGYPFPNRREFSVPRPRRPDVTDAFESVDAPVLVDLRHLTAAAQDWFAAPHMQWDLGASFGDEGSAFMWMRPGRAFDALLYFPTTTRARPLLRPDRPH